ncbi:hypothetical protein RHMOL_Rhmol03G0062800 [Rhododendron molle]|uniref:Uncharacterized protein n=1 Tax=Rhododendron molle TaxID=49168 RepID=A0ACC0PDL8_RHOML|nr:hypothetical protein RHMOL_Rhmol03G0062800 [Rhododendron molle]
MLFIRNLLATLFAYPRIFVPTTLTQCGEDHLDFFKYGLFDQWLGCGRLAANVNLRLSRLCGQIEGGLPHHVTS